VSAKLRICGAAAPVVCVHMLVHAACEAGRLQFLEDRRGQRYARVSLPTGCYAADDPLGTALHSVPSCLHCAGIPFGAHNDGVQRREKVLIRSILQHRLQFLRYCTEHGRGAVAKDVCDGFTRAEQGRARSCTFASRRP
jgi:hypothetical protein